MIAPPLRAKLNAEDPHTLPAIPLKNCALSAIAMRNYFTVRIARAGTIGRRDQATDAIGIQLVQAVTRERSGPEDRALPAAYATGRWPTDRE